MFELKEEVCSKEFSAYRKAEIEVAAMFVHQIWNADPQYIKGALDMFTKIMKIPEKCQARDEDEKSILISIIMRDMRRFEIETLNNALVDNSDV
jgi:hypothetical protein